MDTVSTANKRVLSGMRPTGLLHLGHYHGVLKNWVKLQHEFDCYFFVADWHALTTHYENPGRITQFTIDMVADWLAAGVNPGNAKIFVQSRVREHAELHLLLSMCTPLGWLERVPSYKDQQEKLRERELATYGFLGYPLLQSADILMYRAGQVPVGEDQVAHVEMTREVARRFNNLYGREPDFEERAAAAIKTMGKKAAALYRAARKGYQERGELEALAVGQALLSEQQNLTLGDKERLLGYLEGEGRIVLPEPEALLTPAARMPGLDGQKMSKSYNNTISLRDDPESVGEKLKKMPTDPARVKRHDPGNPDVCPVWQFHRVYSDAETQAWVRDGCTTAGIGCLECKRPVIEAVQAELRPIQERAKEFIDNPDIVRNVIDDGVEQASATARETMDEVRRAMGLRDR